MLQSEYRDLEIHVRSPTADGVYPVTVRGPEDRRAEGLFRSPYGDAEITRALSWMEQGLFDAEYVKEFGATLFQALFAGPLKEVYDGSCQSNDGRLRLRLIVDFPSIARIPWELLYDPQRRAFLALEGPFVRGASLTKATRPLKVPPPLRILVVDAFPQGVLKVQNQAETDGIRQALSPLVRRGRVEVETLSHVTLEGLQNALREAANPANPRPFHILHFIGHGEYDPARGRTVLLFEDREGQIDEVDVESLANVLRPYDLKLIFLNACQSLHSSAFDLARGFAPGLLDIGVPAVIGMQVTVLDAVAVQFAREFYAALADNQPVDAALADARRLARGTRHRRKADMGIPICYLRTETGQILELEAAGRVPLSRETWRPWLRERVTPRRMLGVMLSSISLVATLLGLYWGVIPFLERPAPMTGDVNVAVAEFAAIEATGRIVPSAESRALAQSVHDQLAQELEPLVAVGFDIQLRPPSQVGMIAGAGREERARAAEKLARAINADVIVYGNLSRESDATSFIPEFYLSDRTLQGAEELIGQYEFGSSLKSQGDFASNPVVRQELRARLLERTRALAQFIIGLGYYMLDRYDEAGDYFSAAEQTAGWNERDGKEVLYLFLGNTSTRLRDLDASERYYRRALELNPEYARGWLGVAEVEFLLARGGTCRGEEVDVAGLRQALADFNRALSVRDQPANADIETKAAFGLGRVYLCLSLVGADDRWDDADREFRRVVDDYQVNGNTRVKELASEAHANLGYLYWSRPAPDEQTLAEYGRRAVEEYRQAIALNRHADRRALFYSILGQLYHSLGDDDEADASFAEAIRLAPDAETRGRYEALSAQLREERERSPIATPLATP